MNIREGNERKKMKIGKNEYDRGNSNRKKGKNVK